METGSEFGSVTVEQETDPDLKASLNCVGQILGDTVKQEVRKDQKLMKALVKDMARKVCQHQKRSEMKTVVEMRRYVDMKEKENVASHCCDCLCSLLTGLTEPAIKQKTQTVIHPDT